MKDKIWCLLVHFGALRGPPHDPSVSKFHQVIKIMYPTHQEFISTTNPTFLDQDILIQQGPFPWVKVEKSYHHLPCRWEGGVVTVWSRSWPIITKLGRCSLEHNSWKILSERHEIPMSSHFEPPLVHSRNLHKRYPFEFAR